MPEFPINSMYSKKRGCLVFHSDLGVILRNVESTNDLNAWSQIISHASFKQIGNADQLDECLRVYGLNLEDLIIT